MPPAPPAGRAAARSDGTRTVAGVSAAAGRSAGRPAAGARPPGHRTPGPARARRGRADPTERRGCRGDRRSRARPPAAACRDRTADGRWSRRAGSANAVPAAFPRKRRRQRGSDTGAGNGTGTFAIDRSWARPSASSTTSAPTSARNMSHWASQTSPCDPEEGLADVGGGHQGRPPLEQLPERGDGQHHRADAGTAASPRGEAASGAAAPRGSGTPGTRPGRRGRRDRSGCATDRRRRAPSCPAG